jgi:hypothetical protein
MGAKETRRSTRRKQLEEALEEVTRRSTVLGMGAKATRRRESVGSVNHPAQ